MVDQVQDTQQKLSELRLKYYLEHVIFTPQWWLITGLFLIIIIIWIKTVDRSNIRTILTAGSTVFAVAIISDVTGGELRLWDYPYMSLPWGARDILIDLMIPIFYMWVYQWFPRWKPFAIAAGVSSLIFTFVFEPLTIWLHIYRPLLWKPIYSLPLYFLLFLFSKWTADRIRQLEYHANAQKTK